MTPLHQNDPALSSEPSLAPYGCLVTSLREIAEAHARSCLTPRQILDMYRWLVAQGHVLDEKGHQAFVMDHGAVGRAAQYYLGVPQTFKYVYRHDTADSAKDFGDISHANYFIAQVRIEGWNISHFLHSDSMGERLWDPYWPARSITDTLSLRGYHV